MQIEGLKGKVAIVTGASSGIGQAVAFAYARAETKVVVSDVAVEQGERTVALIRERGGDATFIACDVSNSGEVESLVNRTLETYGQLDFACNNAGIGGPAAPTGDYPLEGWEKVIGINLSGVFYCMKYEIPPMLKQGGGVIVNMASILGHVGFANSPAYVAAKHGVLGLTKTAALEYSKLGIRTVAVCPAFIHTPMIDQGITPEIQTEIAGMHPMGRMGEPEEVAGLVVWLCSDAASFISGSPYLVDGGYVAQ
jgi:NAD(P)-dependent dehydrogenase (short-subunit alcohol dehydrogenase family)